MTQETILKVINSTNHLFIKQGYSKTNISQIAKESGISTGSMYHLVESKTALLQFVLSFAIKDWDLEKEVSYPIKEIPSSQLQAALETEFMKQLNSFKEKMSENYCFNDMLNDAFDFVHKTASCNLILEHNPNDCGQLFDVYKKSRLLFFDAVTNYVNHFEQQGVLKPIPHKELMVRFIMEALSFWGMHLPYDAFSQDQEIPTALAKEVAVSTLCSAYLAKQ